MRSVHISRKVWITVAIIIVVLAIIGSVSRPKKSASVSSYNPNAMSQLSQGLSDQQPKPYSSFGDGVWQVGVDIKPGLYKTPGTNDMCYYERLSGFNTDDSQDIISSNAVNGPVTVEILPTDKAFSSARCGTWTLSQ